MSRLFIWCPLPPAKTGTAVYLAEQLPELQRRADVTVVLPDEEAVAAARAAYDVDVVTADEAVRETEATHFIHLANNPWHAYCLTGAYHLEAFLLIHDMSLHHLITEVLLAQGEAAEYLAVLEDDAGSYGRRFALQREKGYFTERIEFYVRCFRFLVQKARGVVCHSLWAREYMRLRYGVKNSTWVPHHCEVNEQARSMNRAEARSLFGLDDDALVLSVPGYLTAAKDVRSLLRIAALIDGERPVRLLIAGEGTPDLATPEELELFERLSTRTGYLRDEDFDKVFVASDFVSCLRYPTTGESSGVFSKTLAAGTIPLYTPILGGFELSRPGIPVAKGEGGPEAAAEEIFRVLNDESAMDELTSRIGRVAEERKVENCVGDMVRFLARNAPELTH